MGLRSQIARQSSDETLVEQLTRQDIRDATSRKAFERGERYWRQGHVLSLTVGPDGATLTAKVRGTEPRPYALTIELIEADGYLEIAGNCSCPVGFNCKHVAAALLQALAHKAGAGGSAQPPAKHVQASLNLLSEATPAERLEPGLSAWVDSLVRLEQTETEDYPAEIHQRLIYVLKIIPSPAGAAQLAVESVSVRLLKDKTFSDKTTPFNIHTIQQATVAKYLRPSDRGILQSLSVLARSYPHSGTLLAGEAGAAALRAIVATGRSRLDSVAGATVTQGPVRNGRLAWRLADDGSHHPDVALDGMEGATVVRLAPPWYVDVGASVMGPIETGLAARIAGTILSAPAVPARQTGLLRAAIDRRLPALAGIKPPEVAAPERIDVAPVPILRLRVCHVASQHHYYSYSFGTGQAATTERLPTARLSFRYGPFEIEATDPRERPTFARDHHIFEIVRRRNAERKAAANLAQLGFHRLSLQYPYGLPREHANDLILDDAGDGETWFDLLYLELPQLRAQGWNIEIAPDFPIRLVRGEGDFAADLREGSGIDWFDFDLGVFVDGERIDLIPAILAAIAKPSFDAEALAESDELGAPVYLPLPDGRVFAMPAARLAPILSMLHELCIGRTTDSDTGRLGFSLLDAAGISEIEAASQDAGIVWRGGERLRNVGRLLREAGGMPHAVLPPGFTAVLRPYQARGVDWLQFLCSAGLGGVLADEMGLGKTVQALAHLAIERESGRMDGPALVVAPTSVIANWRREAQRFVPGLKVLTLHGLNRKSQFGEIGAHDLVLTTYPLLARDHAVLTAQPWHLVILDEAQTIKNPAAATTQFVRALQARQRLCLTGTPLENHLGELWSLFTFLSPGFLGDSRSFQRNWRNPIEKRGDNERRRLLARRIRPFLLRRTKSEVAAELPPKTEIVTPIEMEAAQRDLYESIRLTMHAKVRAAIAAKGLARSRIVVLDALLKLRQVCCHPRLVKLETAAAARAKSAKLERLMEILPELIEDGRRVLLFSQFTSMLALIEETLRADRIPYVLLTGDTRDRETPIRRFQRGDVPLFLISLKAGGVGLNLTAADTVIHYDPWWNPAVEDQATDRAHRIGQDKPVFVHKLTMLASIEEKMEGLKARKRELAAGLFDPDAGSTLDLTEADIEDLFA